MPLKTVDGVRRAAGSGGYELVVLSPHLDDAALSCGGTLAEAGTRGGRALVVTLCTAVPDARGRGSRRWAAGLEPEGVLARREEDCDGALSRRRSHTPAGAGDPRSSEPPRPAPRHACIFLRSGVD